MKLEISRLTSVYCGFSINQLPNNKGLGIIMYSYTRGFKFTDNANNFKFATDEINFACCCL